MKKFYPFIIYLIAICISFLMHQNKVLGYSIFLLGSNVIMSIYYFIKWIYKILEKQFFISNYYLLSSIIFIVIVLKLNYNYYHPIMLLIPLIGMMGLSIYNPSKRYYLLSKFIPVLVIGLIFFSVSDRQILTFWNPGLTEYNAYKSLEWDSFQGETHSSNEKGSFLCRGVRYNFKEIIGVKPSGIAICGIYKDSSWTNNRNPKDLKILEYRLKISEIYTRKLRKLFATEDRKKVLLKRIKVLKTEFINYDNSYRNEILENNFPENYASWKEKIDSDLDKLSEYD